MIIKRNELRYFPYYGFAVFAAGILVRIAFMLISPKDPGPLFRLYESVSISLLRGEGFMAPWFGHPGISVPWAWYPPGYSLFIAGLYAIFGRMPIAIRLGQILIGSASAVLYGSVVCRVFRNVKLGVLSGFLAACLPILAVHDVSLSTNTSLPLSLMSMALWAFFSTAERPLLSALLCGVALGLSSQFRSEALILFPVFEICYMILGKKKAALTSLAGFLIVITPWTLRNLAVFGVPSPTAPGTGLLLIQTVARYYPDQERGFGFSETDLLAAEDDGHSDVYWPDPYGRDRARIGRFFDYVAEKPFHYAMILIRNTPFAWFGHRLFISETQSTYSEFLKGKISLSSVKGFFDRLFGFIIALLCFILAVIGFLGMSYSKKITSPFWAGACIIFMVFIPLGALGRYTVLAYHLLIPLTAVGTMKIQGHVKKHL